MSGPECKHEFGEPEYAPLQDREQFTDRYTRTCQKCGFTEETTKVFEHVRKVPIFEEVRKAS